MRGRPVIIDKQRLTLQDDDRKLTVQYVGAGDTIQIELPGLWSMKSINTESENDIPSLVLKSDFSSPQQEHEDVLSSEVWLINGSITTEVRVVFGHYVCRFTYPASDGWFLNSFERVAVGTTGQTKISLNLDRPVDVLERVFIEESIKQRKSRSRST